MTPPNKPEYAAPADLKKLFGIGRTAAFQHIAAGDFAAVKLGRKKTLVNLESVRSYLQTLPQAGGGSTSATIGNAIAANRPRRAKAAAAGSTAPRPKAARATVTRPAIRAGSLVVEVLTPRVAPQSAD